MMEHGQDRTFYPTDVWYSDFWSNPFADRYGSFLAEDRIRKGDKSALNRLIRSAPRHRAFRNWGDVDIVSFAWIATKDQPIHTTRWVIGNDPLIVAMAVSRDAERVGGADALPRSHSKPDVRPVTAENEQQTVNLLVVVDQWPRFPNRDVENYVARVSPPKSRRVIDLRIPLTLREVRAREPWR